MRERERIGKTVASLRKWRGLVQEDLGHRAGISDRHIRRIESGREDTALSYYIRLARALNVPLYWLFTDDWPRFIAEYEPNSKPGPRGGAQGG